MARANTVRIEGLEELRAELRSIERETSDMKDLHREVGELVVTESRTIVPVLSGALAGTLRATNSATAATVKAGSSAVDYAGVHHFGWAEHNIEPTPYLYDAADRRSEEIVARYESEINRITDDM